MQSLWCKIFHSPIKTKRVSLFSYMKLAMGEVLDTMETMDVLCLMQQLIDILPVKYVVFIGVDTKIDNSESNFHVADVIETQRRWLQDRDTWLKHPRNIVRNELVVKYNAMREVRNNTINSLEIVKLGVRLDDLGKLIDGIDKELLPLKNQANRLEQYITPMFYFLQLYHCPKCNKVIDPRELLGKILTNLAQGLKAAEFNETSGKFAI